MGLLLAVGLCNKLKLPRLMLFRWPVAAAVLQIFHFIDADCDGEISMHDLTGAPARDTRMRLQHRAVMCTSALRSRQPLVALLLSVPLRQWRCSTLGWMWSSRA